MLLRKGTVVTIGRRWLNEPKSMLTLQEALDLLQSMPPVRVVYYVQEYPIDSDRVFTGEL